MTSLAELADVPEPVRRYLRLAVPPDAPSSNVVHVCSHGAFLVRPPSGWGPFRATQRFTIRPPSFVWDARIRMMPGVSVRVRDSFEDGRGATRARLLGNVTLVSAAGTGMLAAAALQRYLAETVWFPHSLLPGNGVRWSAIDASSALVILSAGGAEAALTFRFGDDGMPREVFAAARVRLVGKQTVPTPWRGRHEGYRQLGGFVIPTRGEVAWDLSEGPQPYWRGEIDAVKHDPAD